MLATSEVQKHIFETLDGDAALGALVQGVYDDVPENAAFPYVTVGEVFPTPFKTRSRDGESLVHSIHVWSRAKGWKEAKEIAEAIRPLFDEQTFSTDSFTGFAVREDSTYLFDATDAQVPTRHIVLEFRFYAHAAAA